MLQKVTCRNNNRLFESAQVKQGQGDSGFIVSSDFMRVAFVFCEKGKEFVVVDGKGHKQYDCIGKGYPIFSPDNKKVAYSGRDGGREVTIVNGKTISQSGGIPLFSLDGKRIAYLFLRTVYVDNIRVEDKMSVTRGKIQ